VIQVAIEIMDKEEQLNADKNKDNSGDEDLVPEPLPTLSMGLKGN